MSNYVDHQELDLAGDPDFTAGLVSEALEGSALSSLLVPVVVTAAKALIEASLESSYPFFDMGLDGSVSLFGPINIMKPSNSKIDELVDSMLESHLDENEATLPSDLSLKLTELASAFRKQAERLDVAAQDPRFTGQ